MLCGTSRTVPTLVFAPGNSVGAKATTSDTVATDTQCYSYDHLSELTAAWTPSSADCAAAPDASALGGPAPYLQQYTYDTATGNRLSASTVNGAASTQQVYAYPAAGTARPHAVSTVTSTGSTNGTSSYGYDGAGDTSAISPETLTSTVGLGDGSTLSKYFRTLSDGTQAWAEVRNGREITNGGVNANPR